MDQDKEFTRYSDEELEEFQVIIEHKLNKAKKELEFVQDQLNELADNSDVKVKGLDDAVGSTESEQLLAMANRTQKFIQHLENALIRIQNKTYGICRVTGKLISKERLKAVPHATLSIDAKQNRNPLHR